MILLFVALLMIGSVAATDTATNDTTVLKNVDTNNEATTTSTTTESQVSSTVSTEAENSMENSNINKVSSESSSNTKTATSKQSTKTNVNKVISTLGSKATFSAVITTASGSKVTKGTVTFKLNGKSIGNVKVSNGVAKTTYTIPTSMKDIKYKITAIYGENSKYKSSSGTNTLKIKSTAKTNVDVKTVSNYAGEKVILQATLTNNGKYVKNGKVAFKINGKTIGTASVSNGGAKLSYKIPKSYTDKQYTITAIYGANDFYKGATGKGTLKVTPIQNTVITISPTIISPGTSTTLTATIKGKAGDTPTGGKVVFKINGKTIGTTTLNKGVAKITFDTPRSWNGKYKISVLYGGHKVFKGSSTTNTLTVSSKASVPKGYESYVKETTNCQVSNSKIQSLSKSLTAGLTSTYSKAVSIFNYVRDKVSYSSYYDTRYGAVGTLNRKYGNCVDQSHLLIALLRAANIPARYCHSTCYFRSGLVTGHVWAGVYVNGKWYTADTTSKSNSFGNVVNWYKCGSINRYISLPF